MALSVSIELVSSSARVTSVKSAQHLIVSDIRTQRSDPRLFLGSIEMGKRPSRFQISETKPNHENDKESRLKDQVSGGESSYVVLEFMGLGDGHRAFY